MIERRFQRREFLRERIAFGFGRRLCAERFAGQCFVAGLQRTLRAVFILRRLVGRGVASALLRGDLRLDLD